MRKIWLVLISFTIMAFLGARYWPCQGGNASTRQGNQTITVEGEEYRLPEGVNSQEIMWTYTPGHIIWAVQKACKVPLIKTTPRSPGGGDLAEGAQDLASVPVGAEGGTTRLIWMASCGAWLAYTAEDKTSNEPLRAGFRLYALNLHNPQGSVLLARVSVGSKGRFLTAAGNGWVAWQWYTPQPPDDRFTLGETRVYQLSRQREWELPGSGWASSLRIEGEELVTELLRGGTERHNLLSVRRAEDTPGAEVTIARADLDGDGKADLIIGRLNGSGTYDWVRVQTADGRTILGPGAASSERARESASVVSAWVADLGAPAPILLISGVGGSSGQPLSAFLYDKARRAVVPLSWGKKEGEWGFPSLDPSTKAVIVRHRTMDYVQHMYCIAYGYRNGRLEPLASWYGPRPEELIYPDDPSFVLLAALTSISLDLAEETPRYFADPMVGERMHREWAERLPRGVAWSLAEDGSLSIPDNGGTSAFSVRGSMPGQSDSQITLQGQVSFVRHSNRYLIEQIDINQHR